MMNRASFLVEEANYKEINEYRLLCHVMIECFEEK